jgi:hypothetical protein
MGIGQGSAFFIPGQGENVSAGTVYKQWTQANGRTFLVEQIAWPAIANFVQALPLHASAVKPGRNVFEYIASAPSGDQRMVASVQKSRPMAAAKTASKSPGLLIDYSVLTSVGLADPTCRSSSLRKTIIIKEI